MTMKIDCPVCGGTGNSGKDHNIVDFDLCQKCWGEGKINKDK